MKFSPEEEKIYLLMRDIILEIQEEIDILKTQRGNQDHIKTLNGSLLAMLIYLRIILVCPIIPISKLSLSVYNLNDKEEDNIVANRFNNRIKDLNLDSYLENLNSIISSRFKATLDIISKHDKIIIFTEFRMVSDAFMHVVTSTTGKKILTVRGNMNSKEREDVFNECRNSSEFILILTYKTGACGLNLQFANTVILLDYTWNASDTNQSISRVSRQGQDNAVNVYFLSSNTGVENAVLDKHLNKLEMTEELATGCIKNSSIETIKIVDIINILKDESLSQLNVKMRDIYVSPLKSYKK